VVAPTEASPGTGSAATSSAPSAGPSRVTEQALIAEGVYFDAESRAESSDWLRSRMAESMACVPAGAPLALAEQSKRGEHLLAMLAKRRQPVHVSSRRHVNELVRGQLLA